MKQDHSDRAKPEDQKEAGERPPTSSNLVDGILGTLLQSLS